MADTKLSNLPAIATGDIDNSVLIYCVDVTGGNISSKVTRSALYLDIANIFTKGQTLSSITTTGLIINPSSAPTGSSSEFIASLKSVSGTVAFGTTPQTGDYITNKIDQATLTNPSSGTVTNASSLKIVGPPVASTNVTITNAYSLWIASGTTLLQATTIATTLLVQGQTTHSTTTNTGIIINPPTAPTGSSSEFVGAINKNAGTIQFASTTQTGDFVSTKYGQDTLTNTSPGTITNASTLKITGAPIASTNVTITNNYALWVAGGNSLFAGTLTSTGGITMSGANIALGGNSITTTNYSISDIGAIVITTTAINGGADLQLIPNGSGHNNVLTIFRTATGTETLGIGSDNTVVNTYQIMINQNGAGVLRPLGIYFGSTTPAFVFNTNNSITMNSILSTYNGIATAGRGISAIYGTVGLGVSLATTATAITSYTPASTGFYSIRLAISCKTSETVIITISYVDPQAGTITNQQIYSKALTGGTTDSLTYNVYAASGTVISVSGTGSVLLGDAYASGQVEELQ